MQIGKTDSSSFKGIYKIKNTPKNLEALKEKIIPIYESITKQPTYIFEGSNPFKRGLDPIIYAITKHNNVTKNWLKMKAEKLGFPPFTTSDDGILHVITNKKDIDEFDEYMKSRMNYRASIAQERILNPDKNTLPQSVANLPECLIHLWVSLTYNKEEDEAFAKYPKKIIEVNSVEELFAKMMSER